MPSCVFCSREELPLLPMMPYSAHIVTAHVDKKGQPCAQGGGGAALPDDYPRDELVSEDGWWDLHFVNSALASVPPLATREEFAEAKRWADDSEDLPPVPAVPKPRKKRSRAKKHATSTSNHGED